MELIRVVDFAKRVHENADKRGIKSADRGKNPWYERTRSFVDKKGSIIKAVGTLWVDSAKFQPSDVVDEWAPKAAPNPAPSPKETDQIDPLNDRARRHFSDKECEKMDDSQLLHKVREIASIFWVARLEAERGTRERILGMFRELLDWGIYVRDAPPSGHNGKKTLIVCVLGNDSIYMTRGFDGINSPKADVSGIVEAINRLADSWEGKKNG